MVLSNTAPGLIRIYGQPATFEKVLKSSIRIVSPNRVGMRIATGFGKKIKKVPERMTREVTVPIQNLYLGPLGTEKSLVDPDTIRYVLTINDEIVPNLFKEYEKMEKQAEMALAERNRWKQKADKFEAENEKLRDKVMEANKLG